MSTDFSKHPVLLTLAIDPESQAFFEALRRAHFPPARNFLNAHLTLFHKLQQARLGEIETYLREIAGTMARFELDVNGLWNLGGGVAYTLNSDILQDMRRRMATEWHDMLINQDRAFKPHITVQNKVGNETALALHAKLSDGFTPFRVTATGLNLWRYDGGPWTKLATFEFQNASGA